MEQLTTLCDMVGQYMQKKEEDKRIAEDQASKDRYWKIPICYDDDEDDAIAITPVLPIEEPDNSLSMGTKHLDNLFQQRIRRSNKVYNDGSILGEDIDYVDASPPDVEIISLEVVEIIVPEVGRIDDDILLTIKDDILREKLLNVNLLIAKIDALRDNPTPSSDVVTKSTSTFSNLFLERDDTFDNSIPESKTFRFNLEEISSGSPTTRSDLSLLDYKAFYVDNDHFKEKSSSSTTTHDDFSQYDSFTFDLSNDQFSVREGMIARIVKTLVLSVLSFIYKSFTSSASFWESRNGYSSKGQEESQKRPNQARDGKDKVKSKPKFQIINEVAMDDAGEDVVRDDDHHKILLNPRQLRLLTQNGSSNLQGLLLLIQNGTSVRPPTPDPEWNKRQVVLDQPE
ncbi:hypothetical protein Tco_0655396 [Tanacetum coccineum]|uniref:Uncharacterized protein n=1 Tax=Tanacetum coccineum TaxID=301880 RepID=A0ABQ4X712_9ASTR